MAESDHNDYSYLWDGTSGWCLVRNGPDFEAEYSIYNRQTQSVLLIKDENEHRVVVKEMLRNDVKVLTETELLKGD